MPVNLPLENRLCGGIREMLVNQLETRPEYLYTERSANPSGIVGSKTNVLPNPLVKKRKTSVTQVLGRVQHPPLALNHMHY